MLVHAAALLPRQDGQCVIKLFLFCKGNPKMEVLYPLVRVLKIDAKEIFYPEMQREGPAISQLRLLIEDCSEEEAAAMIPVLKSVLGSIPNSV